LPLLATRDKARIMPSQTCLQDADDDWQHCSDNSGRPDVANLVEGLQSAKRCE
jgi:hypothetical protein